MPKQFDVFDQQKVNNLKTHLDTMAAKGKAKFYEIYVDSLKAVPKTDEADEFETYEDYLTANTNEIRIVIYYSDASPRNEQYVFSMKAKSPEEALDLGLNGVAFRSYSSKDLIQMRQQKDRKTAETMEIQGLKRHIGELNGEIEEKDEYIERLESGIEQAKANGNKIGNMHIGDIVSVALEGLVRRNTHLIAQVPVLNGLAGIIERDNTQPFQPIIQQPETEVTFKKKEQPAPALTEEDQQCLALIKNIQNHFTPDEFTKVIDVLDALSKDKTQITPVMELLTERK